MIKEPPKLPIVCSLIVVTLNVCTIFAAGQTIVEVRMYSDLINMVGKADEELCTHSGNISSEEISPKDLFQPVLLSQYSFTTMTSQSTCQNIDIGSEDFRQFDWSCFATGSDASRDINWLFVDCKQFKITSVKCLERPKFDKIIERICDLNETQCKILDSDGQQNDVCSRSFDIEKQLIQSSEKITAESPVFWSRMDIMAYICAVFILVSFIVSMVVPAEKCRPRFSYDDDAGLRVPLEIYELYGQHYKPSAKRKLNAAFKSDEGPISYNKPYPTHLQNVAVLANNDMDQSDRDRISLVSALVCEQFQPESPSTNICIYSNYVNMSEQFVPRNSTTGVSEQFRQSLEDFPGNGHVNVDGNTSSGYGNTLGSEQFPKIFAANVGQGGVNGQFYPSTGTTEELFPNLEQTSANSIVSEQFSPCYGTTSSNANEQFYASLRKTKFITKFNSNKTQRPTRTKSMKPDTFATATSESSVHRTSTEITMGNILHDVMQNDNKLFDDIPSYFNARQVNLCDVHLGVPQGGATRRSSLC